MLKEVGRCERCHAADSEVFGAGAVADVGIGEEELRARC